MSEGDPAGRIESALIERWALHYLERFTSSAENLRRVLSRRVRRHSDGDPESAVAAAPLIDALVARLRATGVIDDVAYAASRARTRLRRGQSLRTIRAGLAAKGVAAPDREAAIRSLGETSEGDATDPDLAAACAFARRRRLGPYRRGEEDRPKDLAAFARAGFARQDAETVLACADPAAVEELLRAEAV